MALWSFLKEKLDGPLDGTDFAILVTSAVPRDDLFPTNQSNNFRIDPAAMDQPLPSK